MSEDIVTRLRLRPTILRKNQFGDMETDRCATALFDDCHAIMRDAADEIERLRRNVGCARNQRSTQFCAEALDAQREAKQLRKERDEARLLYCFRCSEDEAFARDMAKAMGWNCFKEIAGSSSTAPTPANTGGGADHQIPEAL